MKLSNLSLAVLSAIALAACGSSGNDNQTTDPGAGAGSTPPKQITPPKDEKKDDDTTAQKDADIVDPTHDQVVDAIVLKDTSTTASQQYIRGGKSLFDQDVNPAKNGTPASATALSGVSLDEQNPDLTNIVLARKVKKDNSVRLALFAGSPASELGSKIGAADKISLQGENSDNVFIGGSKKEFGEYFGVTVDYNNPKLINYTTEVLKNPIFVQQGITTAKAEDFIKAFNQLYDKWNKYNIAVDALKAKKDAKPTVDISSTASTEIGALKGAIKNLKKEVGAFNKYTKSVFGNAKFTELMKSLGIDPTTVKSPGAVEFATGKDVDAFAQSTKGTPKLEASDNVNLDAIPTLAQLESLGSNLAWYSDGSNVGASIDAGWGDTIDHATNKVVGVKANPASSVYDASGPTNGLVGIYTDGNYHTFIRGLEENNVRTTRIFGHYYLDPGFNKTDNELYGEVANSWAGARTFVTGLDSKGVPNKFGLGVMPQVLDHVQYGRVTATILPPSFTQYEGTGGNWVKVRQDYANHDPKHESKADDFYFYRGTGATSIDDMAKLPTDTKITYSGHALMYGIDNHYHGDGLNIPNAFGGASSYGIGNFVEATLDMAAKTFAGDVYNVWGKSDSKNIKKDVLVKFQGNVTGNTVIGHAERTYVAKEDHPADLRASFYGKNAEEVGGSLNSVTRMPPNGPFGKLPVWGGVFGAKKDPAAVGNGGTSWFVSSNQK